MSHFLLEKINASFSVLKMAVSSQNSIWMSICILSLRYSGILELECSLVLQIFSDIYKAFFSLFLLYFKSYHWKLHFFCKFCIGEKENIQFLQSWVPPQVVLSYFTLLDLNVTHFLLNYSRVTKWMCTSPRPGSFTCVSVPLSVSFALIFVCNSRMDFCPSTYECM